MKVSPRELSTIIAALRFYQHTLETARIPGMFEAIASDDGIHDPLTSREIDRLVHRINVE